MTDATKNKSEDLEDQEKKIAVIKHSLIHAAYNYYLSLQNFINNLPIQKPNQGITNAFQFLESGMLWVEKMILQSPLNIEYSSVEKKENDKIETETIY